MDRTTRSAFDITDRSFLALDGKGAKAATDRKRGRRNQGQAADWILYRLQQTRENWRQKNRESFKG